MLIYDLPLAIIEPVCSFVDKYTSDKGTFLSMGLTLPDCQAVSGLKTINAEEYLLSLANRES